MKWINQTSNYFPNNYYRKFVNMMIRSLEVETCLESCQASMITFLLLALNYFLKKASS